MKAYTTLLGVLVSSTVLLAETISLPSAIVTELKDVAAVEGQPLTFALQFDAGTATTEQLTKYGDWTVDFVLKTNKVITLRADADDGTDPNYASDGYLAGSYADYGWVTIPHYGTKELEANSSLNVMDYFFKVAYGESAKLTYKDIYTDVKSFKCGLYLTPEFLADNPGLEVSLELRMYDPSDSTNASYQVVGAPITFETEEEEIALPTATVTELTNAEAVEGQPLTFALQFDADVASDKQLEKYGNWTADFVLTTNKALTLRADADDGTDSDYASDGYLAGAYTSYQNGAWVTIPHYIEKQIAANDSLNIMEYFFEVLWNGPGTRMTYAEVYNDVKSFKCGLYLTPEFLSKNADIELKLELRLTNPLNDEEFYTIGDIVTFNAITVDLPTATVTELTNVEAVDGEPLTFALQFDADTATDEQLAEYGDWTADFVLKTNKALTLRADADDGTDPDYASDGYLAGAYTSYQNGAWVTIPHYIEKQIAANGSLNIMEYFFEVLWNGPGTRMTYAEVYNDVQSFKCGLYLTPEFLLANQDVEITLELRITNPQNAKEYFTIGEVKTFTFVELPTATVTELTNVEAVDGEPLTFALQFDADTATDEQLAEYGNWTADFVLTTNKALTLRADADDGTDPDYASDGYLAGAYTSYQNGAWVTIPHYIEKQIAANGSLNIMEYFFEVLWNGPGTRMTYAEVYNDVQSFKCGLYLTPEYLLAHQDLELTLELRITNPLNENQWFTIGEVKHFVVDPDTLPKVQIGDEYYDSLEEATSDIQVGDTVVIHDPETVVSSGSTSLPVVITETANDKILGKDAVEIVNLLGGEFLVEEENNKLVLKYSYNLGISDLFYHPLYNDNKMMLTLALQEKNQNVDRSYSNRWAEITISTSTTSEVITLPLTAFVDGKKTIALEPKEDLSSFFVSFKITDEQPVNP